MVLAPLVLVAAVQLFYFIYFFSRLAFYREKENTSQSQQHPVSVIVCARDEDENIAKHLPGILVQAYPSTNEVIVVNDNSQDDSKYILSELQRTFKKLQIIELTQEAKHIPGKKFPLSIGIKEAKHEVLLLTDADCVPASEHWMFHMQDAFKNGIGVALGYGGYHKLPGLLNKLIRFETFHAAMQYLSYALAGLPYMGVGRNLAYRKSLFLQNKGFSALNHIPGGDDDLFINKVARAENTAVVLKPEAFTYSAPKTTWRQWVQQKFRHYTTAKYYRKKHKWLLGTYAASLFLFYPALVIALVFGDWRIALGIYGFKLLVQGFVWYKAMRRLQEQDLFPFFIFWDLWLFIYHIIFAKAVWKKPARQW